VLTEPAVATLRAAFPQAEIGFVVKERFSDLVSAHPAIDHVHVLTGSSGQAMRRLISEIRATGYDAAFDLHRNLRTSRIVRASRIPTVTSYHKRELGDAVAVRLLRRPFRAKKMLVLRYLDALARLGVPKEAFLGSDGRLRSPRLYLSAEHVALAEQALERLELTDRPYAAMAPGAMWATKRWPRERFAAVAGGLVSRFGVRVLLLGSAAEKSLCEAVAREAGSGVLSAAGDTTLGETGALIRSARLFIGNDSGPTHMAMALEVPTVAIFGPTDPSQFDHSRHSLIYMDLECSACSFYGGDRCPKGHWSCMLAIVPDDVLKAAEGLLAHAPREQGGRA
jgi:heptosyltransferase-2